MRLYELITELQSMYDKYGDSYIEVAHSHKDILDGWEIDRVCFFKDGDDQTVIILEKD